MEGLHVTCLHISFKVIKAVLYIKSWYTLRKKRKWTFSVTIKQEIELDKLLVFISQTCVIYGLGASSIAT